MNTINYFTGKYQSMPNQIRIANLGTTQAHYAFDYSFLKDSAFNFALIMNTFTYDYQILQKYTYKIQKGAVIIITFEYPIFGSGDIVFEEHYIMQQYAKVLFGGVKNISLWRQFIYKFFPYFHVKKNIFEGNVNLEKRNGKLNHFKLYELDGMINSIIESWERLGVNKEMIAHGVTTKEFQKNTKITIEKVKKIIDYCRDRKWVPVLVALPYCQRFNQRISVEFLENCYNKPLHELEKNCHYYDYSHDKRLSDKRYYLDMHLLNETGRQKFTKIVIEDLKRDQIYKPFLN